MNLQKTKNPSVYVFRFTYRHIDGLELSFLKPPWEACIWVHIHDRQCKLCNDTVRETSFLFTPPANVIFNILSGWMKSHFQWDIGDSVYAPLRSLLNRRHRRLATRSTTLSEVQLLHYTNINRILLCRILRLRRVASATSTIPPQCDPRGACFIP